MYEKHPEYKKNRRFNFFSQLAKHEHSSSDSSLEKYDIDHRKKIIERWNDKYFQIKKIKDKEKKNTQAKIDLAILQQKLRVTKNYDEDFQKIKDNKKSREKEVDRYKERNKDYIYERSREKIKRDSEYGDSDETISKNDL